MKKSTKTTIFGSVIISGILFGGLWLAIGMVYLAVLALNHSMFYLLLYITLSVKSRFNAFYTLLGVV